MSKNTDHTAARLDTRGLPYTLNQLLDIAAKHSVTTAVILGKVQSFENSRNRDVVILIVRNGEPVTIFTRRESQSFDKRNFDVQKIVRQ